MGLHRLYWIPTGHDARHGAYVTYHADELHALVALEAHRVGAIVVGEDLGTVEPAVRETMARERMLRTWVFEFRTTATEPLPDPPEDCIASIGSHDLPRFSAFYRGAGPGEPNVTEAVARGQVDPDRRRERERWRAALAAALVHDASGGAAPLAGPTEERAALQGCLAHLAAGRARLVAVDLEDLWGELEQDNRPGTGVEAGNWRHRSALALDEIRADPAVAALCSLVDLEPRAACPDGGLRAMTPPRPSAPPSAPSRIGDSDLFWFNEGTHRGLASKLGAHLGGRPEDGATFAVWAPSAQGVSVIGDFNDWDHRGHPLEPRGSSGIWEGAVPTARKGDVYKFAVITKDGARLEKADPFATFSEVPPRTGSVLWDLDYEWHDDEWMRGRGDRASLASPISIYEVHLGSWWRDWGAPDRIPSYRELAGRLIEHVRAHGFTHVEFLPLMEHPFYGSWGYQVTGFFAPTSRYGTPQDLMALIDELHRAGIGVILDWVPSHFPTDAFALGALRRHRTSTSTPTAQRGIHPDWNSLRLQLRAPRGAELPRLVGRALAVGLPRRRAAGRRASRRCSTSTTRARPGSGPPTAHGGRENLDAVEFLRQLNTGIYADHPDVQVIAEESTAWPGVSRPVDAGGLGFGLKWDMGWMHDTLVVPRPRPGAPPLPPRRAHLPGRLRLQRELRAAALPRRGRPRQGLAAQQDARRRLAAARQPAAALRLPVRPARQEAALHGRRARQWREWDHERGLDWALLERPGPRRDRPLGRATSTASTGSAPRCTSSTPSRRASTGSSRRGRVQRAQLPAPLDDGGVRARGLQLHAGAPPQRARRGPRGRPLARAARTATPHVYGGSGMGNLGGVEAQPVPWHGRPRLATLTVPPLGCLFLGPE